MTERQQELERRLQDVTGQLGSNKKGTKKGKLSSNVLNIHELNGGPRFQQLPTYKRKLGFPFIIISLYYIDRAAMFFFLFLDDSSKANPQNQSRQSSSSSSSDSSSSSSSDSSSSDSSDSEAG